MSSISVKRIAAACRPIAAPSEFGSVNAASALPSAMCAPAKAATAVSVKCSRSKSCSACGNADALAVATKSAIVPTTLMMHTFRPDVAGNATGCATEDGKSITPPASRLKSMTANRVKVGIVGLGRWAKVLTRASRRVRRHRDRRGLQPLGGKPRRVSSRNSASPARPISRPCWPTPTSRASS